MQTLSTTKHGPIKTDPNNERIQTMSRSYIQPTDNDSCIHAHDIETDYDVMSGHSSYETKCYYEIKPGQRLRENCISRNCKYRKPIRHYAVTTPAMRIRARDWLSDETIASCLKPVSAGMGTIELPPYILGIQGIKVFHCDSGNEVILQINRNSRIPAKDTIADNLQEIVDKSYPEDLVDLINTAIDNKYDNIEISSI